MTTAATSVLFVCVKNGGKSQMAAGLMRQQAGVGLDVSSAGTRAGGALNPLSVQVLQEVGVDISQESPRQLTAELVAAADLVVVVGTEAHVDGVDSTRVVVWDVDEPSTRGIEGEERMRLVRDDIARRVDALAAELRAP
ncbi:low molecular weight phosphatase family protein [Jannaschia sp. R86511]|uniref:arsenate-mycothiol transferase ArsC n=1 Tax=Jannaschia sp. R86511 TaxID=3093853 RepID=UPI0036D2E828